ncbi:MAG: NADH-quinone oxidoreductase subunit L [candidate division NC10 bacterium]|nr:NADH-quinone oxidoreductase subunit L [candidate division NC10 bacterium]MDE2485341.1 NADH-quinone oxidoreductase subunit L [candidate division NC10 bacterium]
MIWLIAVVPLAGSLVVGLMGRRMPRSLVTGIACGTPSLSLLLSLMAFVRLLQMPAEARLLRASLSSWIASGDFSVSFGFLFDPLSAIMALVVCGVGLLIHIYSIGYMGEDRDYHRFFALLNLFLAEMLVLVLADNYLLLFVGWEGVGLCSYLLIGFWFERPAAASAGTKAFLVNRIGDSAVVVGLIWMILLFKSLDFRTVLTEAPTVLAHGSVTALLLTLLLFIGATGKSAQLPLYVWLPDAMEGPTPVSALIHAATMVTAGVYLVARSAPLFQLAPVSLEIVAWVGGLTALYAASIALVQTDIKRIIAYSTISQLGYMFLGLGVGAYTAGIFHLMTHAFFKALLFLSAGSVIHALAGEQDIRKMGGLRRFLRITAGSFLVGALANAGIAPFAGFWSKDEILFAAYGSGHRLLWVIGALTAAGTGLYMFRLYFLAFEGKSKLDAHTLSHLHEAPWSMRLPLVLLSLGSATVGFVGIPSGSGLLQRFLGSVFPASAHEASAGPSLGAALAATALVIAMLGIVVTFRYYLRDPTKPEALAARYPALYRTLFHKYWVDELYDAAVVRPAVAAARAVSESFDAHIVDGSVNGIAALATWAGSLLRRLQTGQVPAYILSILVGAVVLLGYLAFSG